MERKNVNAEEMQMTKNDAVERAANDINQARDILVDWCSNQGDKFTMRIPVQDNDDDMVMSRVIDMAERELQALQTSRPDADTYDDGLTPLQLLDIVEKQLKGAADVAVKRIRAALKSGDKGRWQKIDENTPYSQTVMVWWKDGSWWGRRTYEKDCNGDSVWLVKFGDSHRAANPTHWQDLPAPPTSEGV